MCVVLASYDGPGWADLFCHGHWVSARTVGSWLMTYVVVERVLIVCSLVLKLCFPVLGI